ncbi:hypothetical protein BX661DRAFT_168180 [Kickxella alabastrina]|uniref:uncharacterized protein n=1 Tax=Kickxella alabastrina TaxID=61397 RepID=UPI00221E4A05|nr:uncharacterized protein BX661DRAFT_168180 [Kickxella alabastrina]KAI7835001.1 hypothetical protein BX661DRAFT_168180 [Kickxella alabastrina]
MAKKGKSGKVKKNTSGKAENNSPSTEPQNIQPESAVAKDTPKLEMPNLTDPQKIVSSAIPAGGSAAAGAVGGAVAAGTVGAAAAAVGSATKNVKAAVDADPLEVAPDAAVNPKDTFADKAAKTPPLDSDVVPTEAAVVEPVKTEEPVKAAEPLKTEEPVKAAEPLKTEEPVKAAEPLKTEEPVKATEPAKTERPKHTETPKAEKPKKDDKPAEKSEDSKKHHHKHREDKKDTSQQPAEEKPARKSIVSRLIDFFNGK